MRVVYSEASQVFQDAAQLHQGKPACDDAKASMMRLPLAYFAGVYALGYPALTNVVPTSSLFKKENNHLEQAF
jgi:hypothetical protein